ncbi:MFS transporter [Streptomyces sp. NPDC051940]|uniref:MFS transporter n=1 Tax=Streptomyces sp. NPDC051940 TaxID=3155675 RepID=UPI003436BE31
MTASSTGRRASGSPPDEIPGGISTGTPHEFAPEAPAARLWNRDFRCFFAARTVARFGDGMVPVALAAGLIAAGYGASAVSLALGAWTACFAGFALFGGVLADRFSPRRVMIVADLMRMAGAAVLAADFATGDPHLWLVFTLAALGGVGAALFQPGVASTIPAVAQDVQGANAVIRVSEALMAMAGPATAGVLVGFGGAGTLFSVNAGTFALSALALFLMRMERPRREHSRSMAADLVEGWQEFRAHTWLWSVIAIWTGFGLLAMGPSLPLTAVVVTGEHSPTVYGVMMALLGAGDALGAVLAMRIRPRRPLFAGALALSGFAVHLLALGLDAPLWLLGASFVSAGTGFGFWLVMWFTTVQTRVSAASLNRVHAYDVMGSVTMVAVGQLLAGQAAEVFGAREVLLAGAVVTVVVMAALLSVRPVRELRSTGAVNRQV